MAEDGTVVMRSQENSDDDEEYDDALIDPYGTVLNFY